MLSHYLYGSASFPGLSAERGAAAAAETIKLVSREYELIAAITTVATVNNRNGGDDGGGSYKGT